MTARLVHIGKGRVRVVDDVAYRDTSVAVPRIPQKLRGVAAFYARKTSFEREAIRIANRKPYSPGQLFDIENDACRHIIIDENSMRCGAKCERGKSQCSHHEAVIHGRACEVQS
jgi:hypothetical protein